METDPPAPSEQVTPVPSGSGVPAPSAASEVSPPVPTRPPSPASPSPGVSYTTAASGSAAAPVISLDAPATGTTLSSSNQSAAASKAQSGAKGVKRPLQVPNWRIGAPMFQAANWESIMRPPPSSPHDYVVFASLKDVDVSAEDVIILAASTFSYNLVAADVFSMSQQIGLAFTSAEAASAALTTGLVHDETVIPLARRSDHRPDLVRLTISGVNCTNPKQACQHLVQYFSYYGSVVDVTPRFWANTTVHNGVWHVTVDRATLTQTVPSPPEIASIGGRDVFVDIPGVRRICRVCKSQQHTNKNCRVGQKLAARAAAQVSASTASTSSPSTAAPTASVPQAPVAEVSAPLSAPSGAPSSTSTTPSVSATPLTVTSSTGTPITLPIHPPVSTASPVVTSSAGDDSAPSSTRTSRAAALQAWAETQLETLRQAPSAKARDLMVPCFRQEYGHLLDTDSSPLPDYLLTPEAFRAAVFALVPDS